MEDIQPRTSNIQHRMLRGAKFRAFFGCHFIHLLGFLFAVAGLGLLHAADPSNFRRPTSESDLRYWLQNMVWYHHFTTEEIESATGLDENEITAALKKFGPLVFKGLRNPVSLLRLPKEIKMKAPDKLINKEIPQHRPQCSIGLRPAGSSGIPVRHGFQSVGGSPHVLKFFNPPEAFESSRKAMESNFSTPGQLSKSTAVFSKASHSLCVLRLEIFHPDLPRFSYYPLPAPLTLWPP